MSEVRIEPLFVENGQKLTSVDQKVVMVSHGHDVMIPHTILYFFSVELWLITNRLLYQNEDIPF